MVGTQGESRPAFFAESTHNAPLTTWASLTFTTSFLPELVQVPRQIQPPLASAVLAPYREIFREGSESMPGLGQAGGVIGGP